MMTTTVQAAANNDAELVSASLAGDRDAFGQIVSRYQSLICSLAYSATGSLGQSEDLAQETFITAWKHLRHLRQQSNLRAWLCGIARNRINTSLRREGREPLREAEQLDVVAETASPAPQPHHETISKEEAAILWRSLERIPETYREALVLFYREHQSIENVAAALELSEDAVKQRLSRGRKLLQEQVLAFVEGALERTNPGKAFTVGVLAALPLTFATSAKAATLGAAVAKGGAAATGASLLSVLGVLCGPAIGVLGGYIGLKASLKEVRTPRERAFVIRRAKVTGVAIAVFIVSLLGFVFLCGPLWKTHPGFIIVGGLTITAAYAAFIFHAAWRYTRDYIALRKEEQRLRPEAYQDAPPIVFGEYRSSAKLLGLPLIHIRWGRAPGESAKAAMGWIACGERAYGILFASGAVAVGGISFGGVSVGAIAVGGLSFGLLSFGGFALGALALGGAAVGIVASGGIAVGWHAAIGGIAAARELALGGATVAQHMNDSEAREFFARYHWLNITEPGPRNAFWIVSFAPVLLQVILWQWWRKRMVKRAVPSQMA